MWRHSHSAVRLEDFAHILSLLFWGCAAFDRRDVGKHDQAKPHRVTLWKVVNRSLHAMADKEIEVLREKLTVLGQAWMERKEEPSNPQLVADISEHAHKL